MPATRRRPEARLAARQTNAARPAAPPTMPARDSELSRPPVIRQADAASQRSVASIVATRSERLAVAVERDWLRERAYPTRFTMTKTIEKVQLVCRIDRALNAKLRAQANRAGQTLTACIERALRKALGSRSIETTRR